MATPGRHGCLALAVLQGTLCKVITAALWLWLTSRDSGNVDMTKVFPFLGSTQLEVLSVVGAFLLLIAHLATAYCVTEKVVVSSK